MPADQPLRQPVAQPALGATENLDMLRAQAGFLAEFAEHGFFRRFVTADAALRKLPGFLPDPAPPEQAALGIAEDDADVGSEAFRVNHLETVYKWVADVCVNGKGKPWVGRKQWRTQPCRQRLSRRPRAPPDGCRIRQEAANFRAIRRFAAPEGVIAAARGLPLRSRTFIPVTPAPGTIAVSLALFDLDHTLLAGDSGSLWGRHLCAVGALDAAHFEAENRRFGAEYIAGTLDPLAYFTFAMAPLAAHPIARLLEWREQFIEQHIRPVVLARAVELLDAHRARGDTLVIVTATDRFVTEPIAALLGVPHLLATEPEQLDGGYTGRVAGEPCFREGKIAALERWLGGHGARLDEVWFYSDSQNDLPLLGRVGHPVAVDPDPVLAAEAAARGWPVLSLRD